MASNSAVTVALQNGQRPWTDYLLGLLPFDVATRLRADREATTSAATDFGRMVSVIPAAVLYPQSLEDIQFLIKFSYNSAVPFGIAPRGRGHSTDGQAMAPDNGIVVNMPSLNSAGSSRIRVSRSSRSGLYYADVGGEQLWIDVLNATLKHGLAPMSWTDYLYITVGGTLSNAGISGQTFRYGPQISNVLEMDVITGKGKLLRCSPKKNSELFYGALGGLGQFGIIARAQIALAPAPKRVKWVRMLYDDFDAFTQDQEDLISRDGLDYVEGSLIMHRNPINNWRSSFFSLSDHPRIQSLLAQNHIVYVLEVAKYYDYCVDDDFSAAYIKEEMKEVLGGLQYVPGFKFGKDVEFVQFLNRVNKGEMELQARGKWDVPHPWLNLFVPKSRIADFNSGVFRDIILQQQEATVGPILVYPMKRDKWDQRMSAAVPDEDIFYTVGFLNSARDDNWGVLVEQNAQILRFCEETCMNIKQYLPHYTAKEEWANHFGSKWQTFQDRKARFDPKMILSPGQTIFNAADDAAWSC